MSDITGANRRMRGQTDVDLPFLVAEYSFALVMPGV